VISSSTVSFGKEKGTNTVFPSIRVIQDPPATIFSVILVIIVVYHIDGGLFMTKNTFFLSVSDGMSIAVHTWIPVHHPIGIIQISHGMAEYAMRYDRFAEAAEKIGFAIFASDHRGHGETAGSLDKLGYLADKNGFVRTMEDQHEITLDIKKKFPGIPIILLGHSFGSFISQLYIEKYGELLAGCVLSGTTGPNPALVVSGHIFACIIGFLTGKKKPSPLLTHLSFGSYNKRIPDANSLNSWLSRDIKEVEQYDASPWSGFTCSAGFFQDLTHGLSVIHMPKNLSGIPLKLPILIASGGEDPVGSYGKSVRNLSDIYRKFGILNVKIIIYPGARHEILNETNKDEVTADILSWITQAISPLSPSR